MPAGKYGMHDSGGINTALQPEKHKIYMKKHAVYGIMSSDIIPAPMRGCPEGGRITSAERAHPPEASYPKGYGIMSSDIIPAPMRGCPEGGRITSAERAHPPEASYPKGYGIMSSDIIPAPMRGCPEGGRITSAKRAHPPVKSIRGGRPGNEDCLWIFEWVTA